MGDKNMQLGEGTIYINGDKLGTVEAGAMEYTDPGTFTVEDRYVEDSAFPINLNTPAEFEATIKLPPRAFIKLFGWKWYIRILFGRFCRLFRRKNDER